MTLLTIILVIWLLGLPIAWCILRKWDSDDMTKFAAAVLWPLTLVLYGIYLIHKL